MLGQGAASGPHPGWAPPGWVSSGWVSLGAVGPDGSTAAGGPGGSPPAFAVDRPLLAVDRPPLAVDRSRLVVDRPTVTIDFGTTTAAAMVVTERGSWLVPDPASGEARWPCAIHGYGQRMVAGTAAVQRGQIDPVGYRAGLRRVLVDDDPVVLGSRPLRPVEAVAEFLAVMRSAAGHLLASLGGPLAPPDRAVVTVPPTATPALRDRLVEAAEVAGFTGVELIRDPAAAVWAPGLPLRTGDLVLVYDAGATVGATLVRVGENPEILGHESPMDVPPDVRISTDIEMYPGVDVRPGVDVPAGMDVQAGTVVPPMNTQPGMGRPRINGPAGRGVPPGSADDLRAASPGAIDRAITGCRDLLTRLGINPIQVSWVVVVGGRARVPGLGTRIEQGLGIAVATVDEPELAVVRGAAAWLARSGSRCVPARGSDQRLVPLAYTIPGYTARLVRWLVGPRQPYDEGAVVARVRLATGTVWDLTVRTPGVLDEVLVPAGRDIRSGEWLALVRPT